MKRVCVVVASRANYGRVQSVLLELNRRPSIHLQIVLTGSAVLSRFGNIRNTLVEDGLKISRELYYMVEGGNPISQSTSTGLGLIELSQTFYDLKPDIVLTVADRFETMATAIAASYQNIPLGHIQGGEVSGNIDELVRHSITKLSHYHFPSTIKSYDRIIKLGEEAERVELTGCPSLDLIKKQDLKLSSLLEKQLGVGDSFNFDKDYILMIFHPETEDYLNGEAKIKIILNVLKKFSQHKLVLWPNIDSGTDLVSKGLRGFREREGSVGFTFFKNFKPHDYNILLNNASVCVGNSSSFIRECSYLGTPSVICGIRQSGREHGQNAIYSDIKTNELVDAISTQLKHGRYQSSNLFGDGNAANRIVDYIENTEFNISKKMTY
jgi:UDP-hydrolysing UDP-N-acetyl-D-glucosamine 2-epimerase